MSLGCLSAEIGIDAVGNAAGGVALEFIGVDELVFGEVTYGSIVFGEKWSRRLQISFYGRNFGEPCRIVNHRSQGRTIPPSAAPTPPFSQGRLAPALALDNGSRQSAVRYVAGKFELGHGSLRREMAEAKSQTEGVGEGQAC